MKRIGIMQPYFFPYIGYFQLINFVDEFVIYDNIEYVKKGWINRNRILSRDGDRTITLPIKKGSDYCNIVDRDLSDNWDRDRKKLLNLIRSSYQKAPFFEETYEVIEECLMGNDTNLFEFLFNSIKNINNYLNINTPVTISSSLTVDHSLKCQDKVISICKSLEADVYINSIGGADLYDREEFFKNKICLHFIDSLPITYKQFDLNHSPRLSIIDVMMFNSKGTIREYLSSYHLT